MIPKGQCLIMYPSSNVIITENMDVYEVLDKFVQSKKNYELIIVKLPMKANIDWKEWYGDNGKNNWFNDYFPVSEDKDGKLIWDY